MRTALLPLLVIAALLLPACEARPDPEEQRRQQELETLRESLTLPPVPSLDALEVVHEYEDGSLSVTGLMNRREALIGEEVRVSGLLREIYRCDRAALPEGRNCLHPHMRVSDSLRSERTLLLVGHDRRYELVLSEGQRYTFTGRYDTRHRGHTSTRDGLLVVSLIEGELIPPPEELAELEFPEDEDEAP